MYQDCGGIQLQSFGVKVNFELEDNPIIEVFATGSAAFGIVFRVYIGSLKVFHM